MASAISAFYVDKRVDWSWHQGSLLSSGGADASTSKSTGHAEQNRRFGMKVRQMSDAAGKIGKTAYSYRSVCAFNVCGAGVKSGPYTYILYQ